MGQIAIASSSLERAARARPPHRAARARTGASKFPPRASSRASPAPASPDARAPRRDPRPRARRRPSRRHRRQGIAIHPPHFRPRRERRTYLGNLGGERRGGDDASGGGGDREGHRVNGVARAEAWSDASGAAAVGRGGDRARGVFGHPACSMLCTYYSTTGMWVVLGAMYGKRFFLWYMAHDARRRSSLFSPRVWGVSAPRRARGRRPRRCGPTGARRRRRRRRRVRRRRRCARCARCAGGARGG